MADRMPHSSNEKVILVAYRISISNVTAFKNCCMLSLHNRSFKQPALKFYCNDGEQRTLAHPVGVSGTFVFENCSMIDPFVK
ncbi:hypothetical protein HNY73_010777 [Argiope bruennichi]|uniref:Uncharacterized protein n=1 Tax=Argiope bruennichi TaxID=94029 RepID=A0A8T0F240_ARGBR|nr:hypothetical protein HNY73_010777 [Argiope bruennichi]